MYSDNLVRSLNAIAQEYRGKLEAGVKAELNKIRNTGHGVDSVKVWIKPGTSEISPVLGISVDDHVLLLNKSKMEWTKLPNVVRLTEWAITRGKNEKEAKKLAWATAWDKKKNDTWKSKRWRKKGIGPVLKEMNAQMLVEFEKAIEKDWQEGINKSMVDGR